MSNYEEMSKINVGEHVERKGRFNYLSWAWAADMLLKRDASATWTYGEPATFGETMMVFCSVTAFGKTMTAQLPVMDNKNKSIKNPDSFDINTAMQRCLAKAIALHGIGLYIYQGEDLPVDDSGNSPSNPPTKPQQKKESPHDIAKKNLNNAINGCKSVDELGGVYADFEEFIEKDMSNDERTKFDAFYKGKMEGMVNGK